MEAPVPLRPMYHLTFEKMRQLFKLVHGFLPPVENCTLGVNHTSCMLATDEFGLDLSWPGGITCVAVRYEDEYDLDGSPVAVTFNQINQIVNQLKSWHYDVPY